MRVLIADDEEIIRNGLRTQIEWKRLGCELVGAACDGLEALELFRGTRPHVVITDIRMPRMNGLELAKTIAAEDPECRIMILSGYDDFEFARTALRYGVREYLLKPLEEEELEDRLIALRAELEKRDAEEPLIAKRYGNPDIDRVVAYLTTQYHKPDITLAKIAEGVVFKHPDYLGRLFRGTTGTSFPAFLQTLRVEKAKELLASDPCLRVAELAERVGLPSDGQYFAVLFKRIVGITPSEYRRTAAIEPE